MWPASQFRSILFAVARFASPERVAAMPASTAAPCCARGADAIPCRVETMATASGIEAPAA